VVSLADNAAYTSLQTSPRAARATILDDEIPTIQLTSDDLILTEAGETTGTLTFSRLGGNVGAALNVSFRLSGTSAAGDYTVLGATFSAGTGLWTATIPSVLSSVNVFVRA